MSAAIPTPVVLDEALVKYSAPGAPTVVDARAINDKIATKGGPSRPVTTDARSAGATAADVMARAAREGLGIDYMTALQLVARGAGAIEQWFLSEHLRVSGGVPAPVYEPTSQGGAQGDGATVTVDRSGVSGFGNIPTSWLLLGGAAGLLFLMNRKK